jgi:hypothetical protein
MALLAIRSELATMNVGVAVGTLRTYVAENRLRMALNTIDAHVHATKRITGLVMIKFGDSADRFPTRLRMAIFARNRERPMRTARLRIRRTTALRTG